MINCIYMYMYNSSVLALSATRVTCSHMLYLPDTLNLAKSELTRRFPEGLHVPYFLYKTFEHLFFGQPIYLAFTALETGAY